MVYVELTNSFLNSFFDYDYLYKLWIIEHYGRERTDLVYYRCVFDEEKGEFNEKKPHLHKVAKAWNINKKSGRSIFDGIAFIDEKHEIRLGCNEKNFIKKGEEDALRS